MDGENRRYRRIMLPREASDARAWAWTLAASLAGALFAVVMFWVVFGGGSSGGGGGILEFIAPLVIAGIVIVVPVNVRSYLVARGQFAFLAFRGASAAVASPVSARLGLARWAELEPGTTLTIDIHRFVARGGTRAPTAFLKFTSGGVTKRFAVSNTSTTFDWESWARDAFASVPGFQVEVGVDQR